MNHSIFIIIEMLIIISSISDQLTTFFVIIYDQRIYLSMNLLYITFGSDITFSFQGFEPEMELVLSLVPDYQRLPAPHNSFPNNQAASWPVRE